MIESSVAQVCFCAQSKETEEMLPPGTENAPHPVFQMLSSAEQMPPHLIPGVHHHLWTPAVFINGTFPRAPPLRPPPASPV